MSADMNPWHPITDPVQLKTLGKFGEELGECSAAVSRCIIQGVDAAHPVTQVQNRAWLEDEIADVLAGINLTIELFNLDSERVVRRTDRKIEQLRAWHKMA